MQSKNENENELELEKLLVDEFQASKILNLSVSFLRLERRRNQLGIPFIKIGGSVRYQPHKLKEWVDQQADACTEESNNFEIQKRGRPTKKQQILQGKI